jgi:hypothetical protein
VALLGAFWLIEHRVRSPIVEFELFRNGPYFGASAAGFCLVGCYWALMFLQPQYLQTDLGHSAFEAGALILPVTAPMIVISPLGGRLVGLFGVRRLMTSGWRSARPDWSCSRRSTRRAAMGCCSPATSCSGSRSAASTHLCRRRR